MTKTTAEARHERLTENMEVEWLPVRESVTAAIEPHNGAMIAFVPDLEDMLELAQPNGETLTDMHVTILFLGDAVDWDDDDRESIHAAVADLAQRQPAFTADVFGFAIWNPGNEPCLVANVSGEEIADAHDSIVTEIDELELDIPDQHEPWQPHITLAYDVTELPNGLVTGPVSFSRVRVAFGGVTTDYPLLGAVTAGLHVFHLPGAHDQSSHGRGGSVSATTAPRGMVKEGRKKFDSSGAMDGDHAWHSLEFGSQVPNPHASPTGITQGEIAGEPKAKLQRAVQMYSGNASSPDYPRVFRETGGHPEEFDGKMKRGFKSKEDMLENTRLIDHAMEHSTLSQDVIVHRGLANPQEMFGDAWNDSDVTGLTWREHSYTPTTTQYETALYHADRHSSSGGFVKGVQQPRTDQVIVTMRAPAGTHAVSGPFVEREILLDRGYSYQIVRDRGRDSSGRRRLDAVVIPK